MISLSITPTAVTVALAGGLATVKITTSAVHPLKKGDIINIAGSEQGVVSKCTKKGNAQVCEIPMPNGGADALRLSIQEVIDGTLTLSFNREEADDE
jgi:hypothetical protein